MPTTLLATDIDGTLVGDDVSLHRFNRIIGELRAQHGLKLVYVTGRSPESFDELRTVQPLLEPDALVTAVGTEIYMEKKRERAGWPQPIDWDVEKIKTHLAHFPFLELQPATGQRQYKLGYFLKDAPGALHSVKEALKHHPVEVVYCHGMYLDILPLGAHKGGAVRFLSKKWHIDPAHVIACGDSGNDISMLEGNNAVVVGNAKAELRQWLKTADPATTYIAKSSYAEGILEGLKYYRAYQ